MQNGQSSLLCVSLEEFLCRDPTQFFAASLRKPKVSDLKLSRFRRVWSLTLPEVQRGS
jgi:hypothetical protein